MDATTAPDRGIAQGVFEAIPHGIFAVDRERRITAWNPAAEQITGWPRAEALGRRCADVLRGDRCADGCLLRDSAARAVNHRNREVTIRRRDGVRLRISVSTAPLEDGCAVEMFREIGIVDRLRRRISGRCAVEDVIHASGAMARVMGVVPRIARSDATVLIEGEPGTGKELVARAVHGASARQDGPFVAVNCGAVPDALFESELFGHRRGAFTDARSDRVGRLAEAAGGTLLLDEVGELSAAAQVKLLRVLQEREFTPLGADRAQPADVRVVAATNRELSREVAAGRFRRDLYYRLNVVRLELPPLRERREDVSPLAAHFVQRFNDAQGRTVAGLSAEALRRLALHTFPGNVRELENVIEHAFVMCTRDEIDVQDLPLALRDAEPEAAATPDPEAGLTGLLRAEACEISRALERAGGNRSEAARQLGMARNTLWRKMRRLGLC